MNDAELAALATDAERVHNALATLKWWARGAVVGAGTPKQAQLMEAALGLMERAESTSNAVAAGLAAEREARNEGKVG